jgi:hypothetical protein
MSDDPLVPPVGMPIPRHRPGYVPPPTAAQLADPRDPCHCPLHNPAIPHRRNSRGVYSTFAPACSGCSRGDQDALEYAQANRVWALEGELLADLATSHPTPATRVLAERLRAAIQALAPDLFSVCYAGQRAVTQYEHTVALRAALEMSHHELENSLCQYSRIANSEDSYTAHAARARLDRENLTSRALPALPK